MKRIGEIMQNAQTAHANTPKNSEKAVTRTERRVETYKAVQPDSAGGTRIVKFNADPDALLIKEKAAAEQFFTLLAVANGDEADKGRRLLFYMALQQHDVTVDEAYKAFWKAYADPYLTAGRIEFRNLMKYINEHRDESRLYSYREIERLVADGKAAMEEFEITETKGANGKRKWRKI